MRRPCRPGSTPRSRVFPPPKDARGKSLESKGKGVRSVNTVVGRVVTRRTRRFAPAEGSATPIDRLIDATEATVTVGLREMSCQIGKDCRSMERAQRTLKSAAGIAIGEDTLRQLVEGEGKAVLAAAGDESLEVDWSASQCLVTRPDGQVVSRIYASADGVMVPMTTQAEKDKRRETVRVWRRVHRPAAGTSRLCLAPVKRGEDQRYKQVYVTSMHDQDQTRRLVGVARGDHRRLGRLLRQDAARVLLPGAQERIGAVDGAVCLRKHLEGLPLTDLNLDIHHLSEHVHEGGRITFGEKKEEPAKAATAGTPDAVAKPPDQAGPEAGKPAASDPKKLTPARRWSGEVMRVVRQEGYDPFWDQLAEWRGRQRAPTKRKAADAVLHYVAERKDMMNYPELEKRGCNVGTGPIESMCKGETLRIKGPGMRWDGANAEAMMALEALDQSNLWNKYWAYVLKNVAHASLEPSPG
jgi:hypothetical protein